MANIAILPLKNLILLGYYLFKSNAIELIFMDILIFKTNINSKRGYLKVKTALGKKFDIKEISIDSEDCDKVLRVISKNCSPQSITDEVKIFNFFCEELED